MARTNHKVPSRDHLIITRGLRRVELEHDDGDVDEINPLLITKIKVPRLAARAA